MMQSSLWRRRHWLAAAAATTGSMVGCAARTGAALTPISVISFGGGFNLPLWAAAEKGFFAQEGLAPSLSFTPDSRELFTGLHDGRYHVAITAFDNIVAYQEGQSEVRFPVPTDFCAFMGSDDGFLSLVAVPDVRTVAELRGRTISVDAMSNGFSFVLREILARHGVQESDVRWARAGGTDRRFAALIQRQHDATMLRTPFDIQALDQGLRQLATAREVLGPYLGICGAARRSWAARHPGTVIGFIRAYRNAVRWLEVPSNRPVAVALLQANMPGMSLALAQKSCERMLDPVTGFFPDAGLDWRAVRAVLDLRTRLGQPPRVLDKPDAYIDRSYWERA